MGSKENEVICDQSKGILHVSKSNSSSKKFEKQVKIVEPERIVKEKKRKEEAWKITEKRLKVDALIEAQIQKRKRDFRKWKEETESQRRARLLRNLGLCLLLLLLFLSMAKASLCHASSPYCAPAWHETVLSAILSCFVTTVHDQTPI